MLPLPSCTESGCLVRSVYCVRALAIPAPGLFFFGAPFDRCRAPRGDTSRKPLVTAPADPSNRARLQALRPERHLGLEQPRVPVRPQVRAPPQVRALVREQALLQVLVQVQGPVLLREPVLVLVQALE